MKKKKKENIGKIVVILVLVKDKERASMIMKENISIDIRKEKIEKEVRVEIREEKIEKAEVGIEVKAKKILTFLSCFCHLYYYCFHLYLFVPNYWKQ